MTNALKSKIAKAVLGLAAAGSLLIGAASVSAYTFTPPTMKLGSVSDQVKVLQQTLNMDTDTMLNVSAGNAGSPGHETRNFGPATKAAVIKYQVKHGVISSSTSSSAGIVGPLTRNSLNSGGGMMTGLPAGCTSTAGFSSTTGVSCSTGVVTSYPAGCTSNAGFSVTTGMSCAGGVVVSSTAMPGKLQVMAGNMPALASIVPEGASNVKVGEFTFVAPSDMATTLAGVTIHRSGVGQTTEIANAYFFDGDMRLTSGRTFNSSTNDATFTLNLPMAAGTSKTLSLYVSVAASTNAGSHQFSLTSAASVSATTGATVVGNFPITTNVMNLSTVPVGVVSIQKNGSLSNPHVGDRQAEVAEFRIDVSSAEDAWINKVILTQGGNITNGGLTNFKLMQNGVTVATAAGVDSQSRVTLVFTAPGFKIEKGNNRAFQLYADIGGRPNDTIAFYVDDGNDLMATGGTYGMGMASNTTTSSGLTGANTNFDQSSDSGLTLTLQGGQFTITFTGPSSANISNNGNDVSLWEGSLYTANAVEIKHWRVNLQDLNGTDPDMCDSSSSCDIQDIKIWNTDNNTVIAGPVELTPGANLVTAQLSMNDIYDLAAGSTTHIRITADVKNNPAGNIQLKATLGDGTNSFTQGDIKNIDSNTYLTQTADVSPSSTIAGNTQTVVAAGLTVNQSGSPTDHTMVKGATDDMAAGLDFVVGSGDSVKINTVVLTASASDTNDNTYGAAGIADGASTSVANLILNAKLWMDANGNGIFDSGEQVGLTKSFTSGSATFDNLNWTVSASTTKKLFVSISTNSSATLGATPCGTGGANSDCVRLSVLAGGVSATDSQGNTVAPTLGTTGAANNNNVAPTSANGDAADTVITVSGGGTLVAALAANPTNPASGLMTGGSTGRTFSAYKFSAQNDAFYVKKFVLLPYVNGSNVATSNARISNLAVSYKDEAGVTVTRTVGLSGTSTNVDISSDPMFVPANGDATLTVMGDLSAFTNLDGSEDANIAFAIDGADATNNQATGKGSNQDVGSGVFATTGLDGAGNLVGNKQYIYRTNLGVAASADAPNNTSRTRSSNQIVAAYQYTSTGGATSSYFRGSLKATDGAGAAGWARAGGTTGGGIAASTANAVSGTSSTLWTQETTGVANDAAVFDFGSSTALSDATNGTKYNRVSLWIKSNQAIVAGDVNLFTNTTAVATTPHMSTSIGAVAANVWTYIDLPTSSINAADEYAGLFLAANPTSYNAKLFYIDDFRFYNDSQVVTVNGTFGATATVAGLPFYAKNTGGTTMMYGAWNGTVTGGNVGTGSVTLIPGDGSDVTAVTGYSAVEVATGSPLTLDLWTNTSTLMLADTTANEGLSVSTQTGTPSSAGNFLWYDNSDTAAGNNQAGIAAVNPISTTIDFSNNY